jgi:hypothetical protein
MSSEYNWGYPDSLEFFVNGEKREYQAKLREIEQDIGYRTRLHHEYVLFIDVEFPQNIPVTVRVRYHNLVLHDEGVENTYRDTIPCGTGRRNGPAEYTLIVENRSHDLFWITGTSGIIPQINLLDKDLVELGVEYTVIGDNVTGFRLTPLRQNKDMDAKIVLSRNFYAYAKGTLLFDFIPYINRGIEVSEEILKPYKLLLLTSRQLRILRNAFYAQYGYNFKDPELRDLFQEMQDQWERPILNARSSIFSESLINQIERENISIIRELELLKDYSSIIERYKRDHLKGSSN